jgi:hypothetical protein
LTDRNDHFHELDNPDGLNPRELAAMRWQAIEAFNGVPGLSPMARRLGVKLISCMDAKTRRCYPGEARIAAELGVHLSAVKKAKVELRKAYLINWFNPAGPRHLSHYEFNWAALLKHSAQAKQRGDAEVSKNIANRRQGTHTGTNGKSFNSTHTGTLKDADAIRSDSAHSTQYDIQSTQINIQGTRTGSSIVPTRAPDITQDVSYKDTSHLITPWQATGGPGGGGFVDRPFVSQSVRQEARLTSPSYALPRKPVNVPGYHDQLVKALSKDNPRVAAAVSGLDSVEQQHAARLLATKGGEAALAYIRERCTK